MLANNTEDSTVVGGETHIKCEARMTPTKMEDFLDTLSIKYQTGLLRVC